MNMQVERLISWFDKDTEELVSEMNVNQIGVETLKDIFNPSEEDPLMYNPYDITAIEAVALAKHINIAFDFNCYVYQIDCFQI